MIPEHVSAIPISKRVIQYNRAMGDLARTTFLVPPSRNSKPTPFLTQGLRKMRRVSLAAGGSGLSEAARRQLWDATVSIEGEGLKGTNKMGAMRSAFPTPERFLQSLKDEQDRCLATLGWRVTSIIIDGTERLIFSRNALSVARNAMESASKVQLTGAPRYRCATAKSRGAVRARTGTLDSDLYLDAHKEVKNNHGYKGRAFTLAVQLFSYAALVSHSGCMYERLLYCDGRHVRLRRWLFLGWRMHRRCQCAPCFLFHGVQLTLHVSLYVLILSFIVFGSPYSEHHVYPIRMRCSNMRSGKSNWLTVGYIPWIRPRNAASTADGKLLRVVRETLLQRCLAVLLDDQIEASDTGINVTLAEHGTLLTVPRIVLYACDQSEERHVLGMQGNRCCFPCSICMTTSKRLETPRSLAERRDVLGNLEVQLEGTLLREKTEGAARLAQIARHSSALPFLPVLGSVHGLGTGELALFMIFGFDMLHVSLHFSTCAPHFSVVSVLQLYCILLTDCHERN